jgi:hypothetical protein
MWPWRKGGAVEKQVALNTPHIFMNCVLSAVMSPVLLPSWDACHDWIASPWDMTVTSVFCLSPDSLSLSFLLITGTRNWELVNIWLWHRMAGIEDSSLFGI